MYRKQKEQAVHSGFFHMDTTALISCDGIYRIKKERERKRGQEETRVILNT